MIPFAMEEHILNTSRMKMFFKNDYFLRIFKNLELNQEQKKCGCFFKSEVRYLGKIVDLEGFRGNPLNCYAIEEPKETP